MRILYIGILFTLTLSTVNGQNNTGIGTTTPNVNALLELQNSGNPLGLLLPRQNIATFTLNPADAGMMVFNTVDGVVYTWDGSNWIGSATKWADNGLAIYNLNTGNVGIGTNTPFHKLDVVGNINLSAGSAYYIGGNPILKINAANNAVALGNGSGIANTSNTFLGANSGAVTTGGGNVFVGSNTGLFNGTGGGNTYIGLAAGINSEGSNNTYVGNGSGGNDLAGSGNNSITLLGVSANVAAGATGLNNSTAIGANAQVNASNRIVLGVSGTAVQFDGELRPNDLPGTAGQVLTSGGAGATPNWTTLSGVTGLGTINRLTYWNTSSTVSAGSNLGWDNVNEYLGIGWTAPERPLHLHRAAALDVFAKFTNTVSFVGAGNGLEIGLTSGNEAVFRNYENTPIRFYTNNTEQVTFAANGNVGIGNTSPLARLSVASAGNLALQLDGSSNVGTWLSINNTSAGGRWFHFINTGAGNGEGPGKLLIHRGTGPGIASGIIMAMNHATSNVGIGNTDPWAPLHFATSIANRKIVLWQATDNDHQFYGFGVNANTLRYQVASTIDNHIFYAGSSTTTSNELMRITGAGNMGIGTSAPNSRLEVNGDIRLTNGVPRAIVMTPEPNGNDAQSLQIKASDATAGPQARNGGSLILDGGHNYNISIAGSTPGHVFLRSGGNLFTGGNSPPGDIYFQSGGVSVAANSYTNRAIIR